MFFPFLVVESIDELNEMDLIWSKKNLEVTAQGWLRQFTERTFEEEITIGKFG